MINSTYGVCSLSFRFKLYQIDLSCLENGFLAQLYNNAQYKKSIRKYYEVL